MRIYRDLSRLSPAQFRRPAVTLGVFDGVHRGHVRLFGQLRAAAERQGGETVVVTFDRHPRAVLTDEAPPTITSLEHRLVLFERAGVDAAVVLHFDRELAAVTGESFVRDVLVGRIGSRVVVLGEDAHFGAKRSGSIELLRQLSGPLGYEAEAVSLLEADSVEVPVSSTAIRRAILAGRLDEARLMLGRPVSLLGRVARGDARGRTLGFPTANLELHQEICPPRGVYAGNTEIDGVVYPTMQNVGRRPTFKEGVAGTRDSVEVHLLGFEGDLYGRVLDVRFLRRLRGEQRFPSAGALRAQLERDREAALFGA